MRPSRQSEAVVVPLSSAGEIRTQLLRFVLQLALEMADDYGCVGVIVDAKPDAVGFYATYGCIPVDTVEGGSDARPPPTPMCVPIRAIKDALGAKRQ